MIKKLGGLAILLVIPMNSTLATTLSDKYSAEIDTNKDGAISQAEYIAMARSHFARYDLDKDGHLEGGERPSYLPRLGTTSESEFISQSLAIFNREDLDKNGIIDGIEVKQFWSHLDNK